VLSLSTMPWRRIGEWRYSSTHSLTSVLDGVKWSASRHSRFTPRERAPGTYWIGGWVGPTNCNSLHCYADKGVTHSVRRIVSPWAHLECSYPWCKASDCAPILLTFMTHFRAVTRWIPSISFRCFSSGSPDSLHVSDTPLCVTHSPRIFTRVYTIHTHRHVSRPSFTI
jgi:hypothetical protein